MARPRSRRHREPGDLATADVRSDAHLGVTGVDAAGHGVVVVAELRGGDAEPCDRAGPGVQVERGPIGELPERAGDIGDQVTQVQLDDLAAGSGPGVAHLDRYVDGTGTRVLAAANEFTSNDSLTAPKVWQDVSKPPARAILRRVLIFSKREELLTIREREPGRRTMLLPIFISNEAIYGIHKPR